MSTTAGFQAADASSRAILESLGLQPVINALGPASQLGCATLSDEVRAAMNAAAQHYIPISEMQERASRAIATSTGAQAGCAASGGDACLSLAAAACIAGEDPAAMDRLPDTYGLRNEIVVHRAQRNPFDHALRAVGARFVEFGYVGQGSGVGAYRWQLDAAINDNTAAIFYVGGPRQPNVLPFDEIVEVARARRVPVIVDGAAMDIQGIRDLIARGADLIATSPGSKRSSRRAPRPDPCCHPATAGHACPPGSVGAAAGRRLPFCHHA
jgi:L-seryl-tRNA(Ser) seleniumtransferase